MVGLIHDQPGLDAAQALFLVGLGAGVSVLAGRWAFSPSISVFRALNADAWALVPGLNVSFVISS
jgi:hypothetical protein